MRRALKIFCVGGFVAFDCALLGFIGKVTQTYIFLGSIHHLALGHSIVIFCGSSTIYCISLHLSADTVHFISN